MLPLSNFWPATGAAATAAPRGRRYPAERAAKRDSRRAKCDHRAMQRPDETPQGGAKRAVLTRAATGLPGRHALLGESMRKAAISSVVIGLILVIGAGLMAWWITPSYIARMPSDFNKTRSYDGTIRTLFDPAALTTGNLAAAIKTGLPATLTENVKVQQTSGNTALLQDTRNVMAAGNTVGHIVSNYAVDRKSLEAVGSYPSDWTVAPAKGLTVSWPLGAKQQNYTGWVYMTYTTTPLK